ncbi:hypothetical protein AAZV13_05G186000 [Glycine max]
MNFPLLLIARNSRGIIILPYVMSCLLQQLIFSLYSGCKACGREEIEQGCNGEGRIQGGIATVPGLGWWPIKAYRPCPAFMASGGRYRRQGQSMDEVVSGSGKSKTPTTTDSNTRDTCNNTIHYVLFFTS